MFSKILISALLAISSVPSVSTAATVTYDLTATVASGPGLGFSTLGSVSFDDQYLQNGDEVLGPMNKGGVTLTFGLVTGGKTVWFTQNSDSDYPTYPQLFFTGYNLTAVNFRLLDKVNGVNLARYGVLEVMFASGLQGDATSGYHVDAYVRPVDMSPVPVPAGLPLLAAALSGLAFAAWRRAKPAAVAIKG